MISYKCGKCGVTLESDDSIAGKPEYCPVCKHINVVPKAATSFSRVLREPETPRRPVASGGGGGGISSGGWGWIGFILIFGVGNLILYKTTGWFIIPIPRR